MKVRQAVSADHQQLIALYGEFIETDRFKNLDNDGFQKVIRSKNNFVLVAEEDSKLIGLITASARLVVRYPIPIMQVDEFYVDIAFRSQGIGQKLMLAIEDIAQQKGYQRIYIESGYQHEEQGHKFYKKNGYDNKGYYFLKIL